MIINKRKIATGERPYIVAELSANHGGDINKVFELMLEAKKRGADAVKLQTYSADTITIDDESTEFRISGGQWDGYTLYNLYKEAETPFEWHKELFQYAKKIGITCFSTPFDESAVDLLETLNAPAYKVASFELTDLPLIDYIARTKKPMIMSTGMANEEEIEEAVETARNAGCLDLLLLHCVSGYPTPVEESNVLTIPLMRERFGLDIGLSDHTLSNATAVAAVSHGACFIEKHFTLSRHFPSHDALFSIEPDELESLCELTHEAWLALGKPSYEQKSVEKSSVIFRRSLYFVKDIKSGEAITKEHVRRIRPGYGLPPKYETELIGMKAVKDIKRGTACQWELVDG